MGTARIFILTLLAMIAFASNSILCRGALKESSLDPATFTLVRIFSGAAGLWLVMSVRRIAKVNRTATTPSEDLSIQPTNIAHSLLGYGNWISATALFVYAAGFSFAYTSLSAGTGALLLFGAVQATMILWGLYNGERLSMIQIFGFMAAITGLCVLLFPGFSAPPLTASMLMLGAGIAWGIYSLRGKGEKNPASVTTGNFIRAVLFAVVLSLALASRVHLDLAGIAYAVTSGAVTSGLGYVIWYSALPGLTATGAATVQLSVPVLAATGGILLLSEPITFRYVLASVAVLGGIAVVIATPHSRPSSSMR
jgi:drug/metabolite transporter (DMT)-like permease